MKSITVVVRSAKEVFIDFDGYEGDECFNEAKKLEDRLKKKGIKVTVRARTKKTAVPHTNTGEQFDGDANTIRT